MKIVFITINFNGADQTIRLLSSLLSQTPVSFQWQVVVVDNASENSDYQNLRKFIEERMPGATLIRSEINKGFSGGNNLGISTGSKFNPDWFVFINNDTWAEENFISSLYLSLEGIDGVVAIPLQEMGEMTFAGQIRWLHATMHHLHKLPEKNNQIYAIGAGVALHKNVFEKIGYWDERYFLYFEDADLSKRAQNHGFRITIAPLIHPGEILHHESLATTKKLGSSLLLRYHYRNAHLFNSLHAPNSIKVFLPFWSFFTILKQLLKLMIAPEKRLQSKAIIAGIMDFYRGKFGKV